MRLSRWLPVLLVLSVAPAALAQTPRTQPRAVRLPTEHIKGEVHRPQAFYILQRSSLHTDALELKTSFTKKILASSAAAPF
jgi:hypothetical protein